MLIVNQGTIIGGKYKAEAEIGRGGMGVVLRAKAILDGTKVAVKVCDTLGQEELVRRLRRELRIMRRMSHPNVVSILDADLDNDPPYIVMPLARGSLQDELPMFTSDADQAIEAFRQVCIGVQAVHEAGVFHRDLKPANCLRMNDGRIVVSDMGLARLEVRDTTVLTDTNVQLGTVAFMAPEQLRPGGSRDADARTDICQLGKTLYYMLTGHCPLLMDMGSLPLGISHIITRATRPQPEDRYQAVTELIDAVDIFRRSQDPAANPRAAFNNLLQQVAQLINFGQYHADQVRSLFNLLERVLAEDLERGLADFDQIPDQLLPIAASHFEGELLPVMRLYVRAVRAHVGGHAFEYAEVVAQKMQAIFTSTDNPELRTLALQAILLAGVALNRFAAMDTFNRLLRQVTNDEGLPVAEMLRANLEHYRVMARLVGPHELPLPVRTVREEAMRQPSR